ncbi:iron-sulfur cluster assembly accessory protein [Xanthobacter sp. KR7-65]|uniref:HesB/IscA family protein n=1 Tax=Xanthobacter sp. KR7-65 TaxID=3156612 RepID=UPI0032B4C335
MIRLTTSAVQAVKAALSQAGDAAGLRVVAEAGADTGVRYLMHLEQRPRADDAVIEQAGLKVFIDGASQAATRGIRIDFVNSAAASGFVFENDPASLATAAGGLRN